MLGLMVVFIKTLVVLVIKAFPSRSELFIKCLVEMLAYTKPGRQVTSSIHAHTTKSHNVRYIINRHSYPNLTMHWAIGTGAAAATLA